MNRLPTVVIGIDFGTLSGRALVVSTEDGTELGTAVHEYRHGVVERQLPGGGAALKPQWALQVPQDWRDVLVHAVPAALAAAGVTPEQVIGIGTDFTACTVLPVTSEGVPLCELDDLRDRPHAYAKLWKHHAAQPHADRINALAAARGEGWLARYGGKISSEWQFAKGLQLLEEDPEVYRRADRWIEAADWIIWELCGTETRNLCTAGYKGIFQDGNYPSREFLEALNPDFGDFVGKLEHPLSAMGERAGGLSARAAAWMGLPEGVAVAIGNVDAHVTSVAAGAIDPGQMLAVMGTSTCHILNGPELAEVPGMCGAVRDGVIPGLWGYEAGQSGVGDIFAWFIESGLPEEYQTEARERGLSAHELLSEKAAKQPVGQHGLVALDWHGGNRSVLVDHDLSGVLVGATLATRPEEVYRALLEATAFGTRTIIDAFEGSGVRVDELIVAGGLLRSSFLMQIYADIIQRPLSIIGSAQGPALGSAIHAAVAAGAYPDLHAASAVMARVHRNVYQPDPNHAATYDQLYAIYTELHDHFGRGGTNALHRLHALRNGSDNTETP
ncbi:ribulokinase [Acrocarpospora pleiomorpha]|uniref:Ribulokinase n=1 Tax=Acrocarpospora pleiomorpha TaxID=90975 RepID=A0A5M3XVQ2_9ACTN|nr:ribulokinase [Acrocarpospora pleiomorpha]GES22448.1 ribulokinase [Acrocarpospora pleiomorpha]